MKSIVAAVRSTLVAAVSVSLLAGCGGSQASLGAPPLSQSFAPGANRSWISPQSTTQGNLLYVSNLNNTITVYSYPSGSYVTTITNSKLMTPAGSCADEKGDVYVTSLGNRMIFEYARGGTTPIASFKAATPHPESCSVDLTTGNLAVCTNGAGTSGGNVAIYKGANPSESKLYYDHKLFRYWFCGYDDASGSLFVLGQGPPSVHLQWRLAELNANGKFTNITLNQAIGYGAGVQWGGKYVVIGDAVTNELYQFSISGTNGTLVNTTALRGAGRIVDFESYRGKVTVADGYNDDVAIYPYPAGGRPQVKIIDAINDPTGVAISVAGKER